MQSYCRMPLEIDSLPLSFDDVSRIAQPVLRSSQAPRIRPEKYHPAEGRHTTPCLNLHRPLPRPPSSAPAVPVWPSSSKDGRGVSRRLRQPLDWEGIGRKALAKGQRVPVMDFMLGPLAVEQKKRVIGKRAKFKKNKEDTQQHEDIVRSENETTMHVINIWGLLLMEQNGPVNLFRFFTNPNDFAQSVENLNLFYLSFLIRDGECVLKIEEDGDSSRSSSSASSLNSAIV